MCGRYVLHGTYSQLQDHFHTENWPDFADRYNIAPSASVPIIRQTPDGRRVTDLLRWGLIPNWSKDLTIGSKLNNARGETVAEKPSFRNAYRKRRCIVPASGYYEWQEVPGEKKQPWYIHLKSDEPMAMGGLWESWTDPASGEIIRTFCIVTVGPNDVMSPIHDRMPVILKREDWPAWFSPEADMMKVAGMVGPASAETMEAWPVSRRVSRATEEEAALIERANCE